MSNVTNEHEKTMQFVNMISDLNMAIPVDKMVRTQALYSNQPTFYHR